jgi:hypothetical protein
MGDFDEDTVRPTQAADGITDGVMLEQDLDGVD